MGWRGKTSDDVVILALLQGEKPASASEVLERIDGHDWKRAFELGEGRQSIALMSQNITTRLRRLTKKGRLLEAREKIGGYTSMVYQPLKPGEAEKLREERLEAARPTQEDRALAAELAQAAEVEVEMEVYETNVGVKGLIRVASNKGSSERTFYPGDESDWPTELRDLLAPDGGLVAA